MDKAGTDVILISGYAKLPANTTSEEVYKTLVLVVLVDMTRGEVVNAECSVVTDVTKSFVAGMIIGYNLNDGPEKLIARFDKLYYGHAKRAIETSLKMVFAKFKEIMAERQ
ncbi:protein of unknown function [Sporobacter termitidis DSM 10068]|uniref:DUF3870 domain-containing protein n=1 Tax=Sporobacter termitidis DSM 10068 TaxID=1123282 RepID=A0A1M5YUV0_9FIRM|nr:DUF3870 domain-containing protein [Sporobacter termitidis]SHI15872.1 protein of unknown function [Sporobacter termitidis DSM 10068]